MHDPIVHRLLRRRGQRLQAKGVLAYVHVLLRRAYAGGQGREELARGAATTEEEDRLHALAKSLSEAGFAISIHGEDES